MAAYEATHRLLVFVEDPGAVNYVVPVLPLLERSDWTLKMVASGPALSYLADQDIIADALEPDCDLVQFLECVRPGLLLVGTSENQNSPALSLVVAARRLGIISIGVIDGPANAEYRFKGRGQLPLEFAPDWLLLPDDWTARQYESLGYSRHRMAVCGHPFYDAVREQGAKILSEERGSIRRRLLPDAPRDQRTVVFLTERSDGLDISSLRRSSAYTLHGRGGTDHRTKIVIEEFLDAANALEHRPYLVLRVHPKDDTGEYSDYFDEFDWISDGGQPLPLVCAVDLVVGMSTSLLVEAAILGTNTLSILPHDGERDWIATVRNGITPCATERAALRRLLPEVLENPRHQNEEIDRIIPLGARQRVVDALSRLRN